MSKAICTTTIYPPSKALLRFIEIAAEDDWHIYVAGDQKTPHDLYIELEKKHAFFHYITPTDQTAMDDHLSEAIGWNCIQRRNFAFLAAHKWLNADVVASVDDDNIPYEGWGRNLLVGQRCKVIGVRTEGAAFDPMTRTNHNRLWHRGFPIQLLAQREVPNLNDVYMTPDVQADFWDGDPDVDAICRMEHGPKDLIFTPSFFPFTSDKPAPFNSQNTFLTKEVLPHYCMLPHVGRADDIWPAYHVQAQGFKVVFGKPSVVQERNAQDVMKNFRDEQLNYMHNLDIVHAVNAGDKEPLKPFLPERAALAFHLYQRHFK